VRRFAADYEVITPLMVGGANHAPEFRLASFVNLVRWWWRFLALGRYGGDAVRASLWEAILFGWPAKPFGRKRISFRLTHLQRGYPAPWTKFDDDAWLNQWSGINYLTAQSFRDGRKPVEVIAFRLEARLSEFDQQAFNYMMKETGVRFDYVNFRQIGPTGPVEDQALAGWETAVQTLQDALALVGLIGGLGARNRRGFGSLAIKRLVVDTTSIISGLPPSVDAYLETIKGHIGSRPAAISEPPYTAYGQGTKIEICCSGSDARLLMNEVGWAFQIYRSWGQRAGGAHVHNYAAANGKPRSLPAGTAKRAWYEPKFQQDHDDFYNSRSFPPNMFDHRSVFGLPHNYGSRQVGWHLSDPGEHGRRSSPLFFHFHRLGNGRIAFAALLAPARFVPSTARLNVGSSSRVFQTPTDWALLSGFIDFLRDATAGADNPTNLTNPRGVIYTTYARETGAAL
jgi:hypothetical protein